MRVTNQNFLALSCDLWSPPLTLNKIPWIYSQFHVTGMNLNFLGTFESELDFRKLRHELWSYDKGLLEAAVRETPRNLSAAICITRDIVLRRQSWLIPPLSGHRDICELPFNTSRLFVHTYLKNVLKTNRCILKKIWIRFSLLQMCRSAYRPIGVKWCCSRCSQRETKRISKLFFLYYLCIFFLNHDFGAFVINLPIF